MVRTLGFHPKNRGSIPLRARLYILMQLIIYWLISENYKKTYVGYTSDIKKRMSKHLDKGVKSTKYFGKFKCYKLDQASNTLEARKKEKYWKSSAGRKKLKTYFNKIVNLNTTF